MIGVPVNTSTTTTKSTSYSVNNNHMKLDLGLFYVLNFFLTSLFNYLLLVLLNYIIDNFNFDPNISIEEFTSNCMYSSCESLGVNRIIEPFAGREELIANISKHAMEIFFTLIGFRKPIRCIQSSPGKYSSLIKFYITGIPL